MTCTFSSSYSTDISVTESSSEETVEKTVESNIELYLEDSSDVPLANLLQLNLIKGPPYNDATTKNHATKDKNYTNTNKDYVLLKTFSSRVTTKAGIVAGKVGDQNWTIQVPKKDAIVLRPQLPGCFCYRFNR